MAFIHRRLSAHRKPEEGQASDLVPLCTQFPGSTPTSTTCAQAQSLRVSLQITWQMIMNPPVHGCGADSAQIQRVIQHGIDPSKDTGIATGGECRRFLVVPAILSPSHVFFLETEKTLSSSHWDPAALSLSPSATDDKQVNLNLIKKQSPCYFIYTLYIDYQQGTQRL